MKKLMIQAFSTWIFLALMGMGNIFAQTPEAPSLRPDTLILFHAEHVFPDAEQRNSLSADEMKSVLSLGFYTANSREDMDIISPIMGTGPCIVIKRLSFLEGVKAVQGLQSKITEYGKLDQAYKELEAIEEQRRAVFHDLIKQEQNRTQLFMQANDTLRKQIDLLNGQFTAASATTHKALKNRNFKVWRMGILGGIIGLSTGILLGVLGKN